MTGFDFNSPVGVKAAVECHLLIVSAGFDIPAVRPELVEGNGSDAQDRPASTQLSAGPSTRLRTGFDFVQAAH